MHEQAAEDRGEDRRDAERQHGQREQPRGIGAGVFVADDGHGNDGGRRRAPSPWKKREAMRTPIVGAKAAHTEAMANIPRPTKVGPLRPSESDTGP